MGESNPLQQQKVSALGGGALVISLDFELHWGVRDHLSVAQYRKNLLGAREAVGAVLKLFEQYDVHATWATVGFLFFENKTQLVNAIPAVLPRYADPRLSPYDDLQSIGANESEDPFHYAASLIRQIVATPGQELATHTFSHYYCLEAGQDAHSFEADLEAAQRAAALFGVKLKSLVLPRNQVNDQYLEVCRRMGLVCYRGDAAGWFSRGVRQEQNTLARRLLRFADTFLPLCGTTSWDLPDCRKMQPANVPASRFLRPWKPLLSPLQSLQLRRIRREITTAARAARSYHVWWHPHNFGAALPQNLSLLRKILEHFAALRDRYGMRSLNMAEVAGLGGIDETAPLTHGADNEHVRELAQRP